MYERALVIAVILVAVPLEACSSRGCAVYRFGVIGESSEAQLVVTLKSGDPEARASAAKGLGALGASAKSAVPALKEALTDPDEEVRLEVAKALQRIEFGS